MMYYSNCLRLTETWYVNLIRIIVVLPLFYKDFEAVSNHVMIIVQIPAMQRRHITPYPNAPNLSSYDDMSFDSNTTSKTSTEQEQSFK